MCVVIAGTSDHAVIINDTRTTSRAVMPSTPARRDHGQEPGRGQPRVPDVLRLIHLDSLMKAFSGGSRV